MGALNPSGTEGSNLNPNADAGPVRRITPAVRPGRGLGGEALKPLRVRVRASPQEGCDLRLSRKVRYRTFLTFFSQIIKLQKARSQLYQRRFLQRKASFQHFQVLHYSSDTILDFCYFLDICIVFLCEKSRGIQTKCWYEKGRGKSCRGFNATIRTGILRCFILAWSWGSRNGVLQPFFQTM